MTNRECLPSPPPPPPSCMISVVNSKHSEAPIKGVWTELNKYQRHWFKLKENGCKMHLFLPALQTGLCVRTIVLLLLFFVCVGTVYAKAEISNGNAELPVFLLGMLQKMSSSSWISELNFVNLSGPAKNIMNWEFVVLQMCIKKYKKACIVQQQLTPPLTLKKYKNKTNKKLTNIPQQKQQQTTSARFV